MRYLVIYRPTVGEEGGMPDPEHMAAMNRLVQEMTAAKVLIGTEPLAPRVQGGRVQLANGVFTVTDEDQRAAGYALLNAGSKAEVIEQCKQFLEVAGDGVTEIRQIVEFGPPT